LIFGEKFKLTSRFDDHCSVTVDPLIGDRPEVFPKAGFLPVFDAQRDGATVDVGKAGR
jgi:hypothetical protein